VPHLEAYRKKVEHNMKPEHFVFLGANPAGHIPTIDDKAFVHESARIIGNVRIGGQVFVGPAAVVRADEPDEKGEVWSIVIQSRCNLQDGVILHALGGTTICIEPGTSVSHGAVVHGPCEIGANCFIGFRAVIFDAILGEGVYVGAGAVVQQVRIPDFSLVPPGSVIVSQEDADRLGRVGRREQIFMETVVRKNMERVKGYSRFQESMEKR